MSVRQQYRVKPKTLHRQNERVDLAAVRFDQWTKQIVARTASRRGLLRFGLGGGLAALGLGPAQDVAACRGNGKPCDKSKKNGGCCSGTCKKGTCRPTSGAAGCKVGQNICQGKIVPCPRNPDGYCFTLDNGKPFCAEWAACEPCASHADCALDPGGKCMQFCPGCAGESGGQTCLYPQLEPVEEPVID